jgi:hypothetical protein
MIQKTEEEETEEENVKEKGKIKMGSLICGYADFLTLYLINFNLFLICLTE